VAELWDEIKYLLTIIAVVLLMLLATPTVFVQGAGNQWDVQNQQVEELN